MGEDNIIIEEVSTAEVLENLNEEELEGEENG